MAIMTNNNTNALTAAVNFIMIHVIQRNLHRQLYVAFKRPAWANKKKRKNHIRWNLRQITDSPLVSESKTVLDSGFQSLRFLELYSGFQNPGSGSVLQAKFPRNPESLKWGESNGNLSREILVFFCLFNELAVHISSAVLTFIRAHEKRENRRALNNLNEGRKGVNFEAEVV